MVALRAQTGIVFLAYRATAELDAAVDEGAAEAPLLDVAAPDGVRHSVWRLSPAATRAAAGAFADVPAVYIADGHHRIASAARARDELAGGDPQHEACFFLGVAFPDRADAHPAVQPHGRRPCRPDRGGASGRAAGAISGRGRGTAGAAQGPDRDVPGRRLAHHRTGGRRRSGRRTRTGRAARRGGPPGPDPGAAVRRGGHFARIPRVGFVGGARGVAALEQAVDSGAAAVAFSLAAVTPDELLAVSDAGGIMPPKSTWFEPKLRDGLLIHTI